MARGRFIDNKIVLSKQVNSLSDDTCRLLFTWMITFADKEGRLFGDPAVIRGTILPRNEKITIKKVEAYLSEMESQGLILLYEAKGDKFILFPTFSGNQLGLRKDKEPNSNYPAPSDEDLVEYFRKFSGLLPDDFLQSYGVNPDKIPLKLIKENLREVNTPPTPPNGEDGDFSEFDPVKVFSKVTGMAAIPAGDMPAVMTALDALWQQKGKTVDSLANYLTPFYEAWTSRRGKNGAFYSKTNCTWLTDWAVAGEIPPAPDPEKQKTRTLTDPYGNTIEVAI